MGTTNGGTAAPVTGSPAAPRGERSVADRLFEEGYAFDFFQAVRVLERLVPQRRSVGRTGPPHAEAVRFCARLSLSFPPSSVYEVQPASSVYPVPLMTVAFMGLTGPSGVLPHHYTELLLRQERQAKGPEKSALRAWLDLFNHRLISLFYRAWEKYRFYVPYERGEHAGPEPDPFTRCLFSLVGLGVPALRNRLQVVVPASADGRRPTRILARVDDLALLHYSGFFAHRPRCAVVLEALLSDYFGLDVKVRQFQGQWLLLDAANRTHLGGPCAQLGIDTIAGARVWDVQGKICIRLGPLRYDQFDAFLPDPSPTPGAKRFSFSVTWYACTSGPSWISTFSSS